MSGLRHGDRLPGIDGIEIADEPPGIGVRGPPVGGALATRWRLRADAFVPR